ncbi:molybdenum cofactor guanylyltransferase [Natranaerobius thermophilus]|uniref:Probable molybdenum cofactor guanylyltransferase n=1 Tax=Natranaerobius thermophilus (strain ATCC BAA-1301 / DSM 18059 / JW/NM-WN-LF) TaxID=457570 RepID=MOBA_NATTJ|nr:molybdenum cofactor guanylyltransferase [Natranaerobius thermophilus]B2A242.1 RecName: Full=Probable molybdenum cofactor guanylyltransferase; Short=MoCo guanylyltransferase; AltName: Full=GTP:molybdopterin guanylyltransferase; AltName: Full=Mo-MPT guanylyltransferase; AltName: Full=Molybdopterin guanylyltransferase; AltName: Full=Molybdopterin-guanine dinucleotide synthase; Short=MGD synthase [Natranaerobius thermophilus JW/NM-WN-LF]ACB84847.1 formate dehydrogenase family accessory protein Fdh
MTDNVSAVILAGGASRRMGTDKSMLKLKGKKMIEIVIESISDIFDELVIVSNSPEKFDYKNNDFKVVSDKLTHLKRSSLRGIYTGLTEISNEYGFIFAGDMPFISPELIKAMISEMRKDKWDIIIPVISGHYEPLFAVYHKNCHYTMKQQLLHENFKITDSLKEFKVLELTDNYCVQYDEYLASFFNINTPEDLEQARKYLGKTE